MADSLCDPKEDQDGEVSVMSLKATLANDTTVNSDYAAIVPAKRKIDYIAFTTASGCTADKSSATHYSSYSDAYDLYQNAQDAAESAPSIECVYNGGALNLANQLCVHYTQADYGDFGTTTRYCEGIMDLADLESWGLSLEFASIPFQVGTNGTDQSDYCIVTEDGNFTPAYISGTGTTAIEKNSTSGKSSIGRTPLVVVKLVDDNGSVVAFGYVRIKIIEAPTTATTESINLQSVTTAYDCDTKTDSVAWETISSELYEHMKTSAEDFRNHYTTDGNTYIVNAKQEFVQSSDYGSITQSGDLSGDNTTTVLKVTVTADQKFNIVNDNEDDRTQTIYIKYSYGSSIIYVGFDITVLDLPDVTFGNKIGRLWEDGQDGELNDGDKTQWNVPSPGTSGKDVTDYILTLDDLFTGNKVVATLGGEYADQYKASDVSYTYGFATTQDKIDSYSLYVNADGDKLFANKSLGEDYLVASIIDTKTGVIRYATTDVAKEILNLYAHDYDGTLAHAKVKLTATYGSCERELNGDRTFIVDFLRPIDIVAGQAATFADATTAGSRVSLADLISIKDWRNDTVYNKNHPNGNVVNGVNLYTYYQFKNVEVDLEKTRYNGLDKYASDYNVKLSLVDATDNALSNTQAINAANALSGIYVRLDNTGSVTQDYTLKIPIKLTYVWGTVECFIDAKVKGTF